MPSASTLQTQVVGLLNDLLAAAVEISLQVDIINQRSAQYTSLAMGTAIAAFPTAIQNTDGSLGTADVTPNVAHPINAPVLQTASGLLLARALSSNDFSSLLTALQGFATIAAGTALSANGATPQLLAKVRGT